MPSYRPRRLHRLDLEPGEERPHLRPVIQGQQEPALDTAQDLQQAREVLPAEQPSAIVGLAAGKRVKVKAPSVESKSPQPTGRMELVELPSLV